MDNKRIIDRFDEYMRYKHLTDNKVTVLLGLSNGVIGKSRKERRDLSDRVVEQIEKFFPDLNPDWLKYGEGDMLAKRKIPLYDNPTIGGVNEMAAPVDEAATPSEWIDAGDWFPTATSAIHHYGESMTEYPSGCILVLVTENIPKWKMIASHTARRTFVTVNILRGKNIHAVKRCTGHSDLRHLEGYVRDED